MLSELLLAILVAGSLAAAVGTLVVVARDGYRRIPTDRTRIPAEATARTSSAATTPPARNRTPDRVRRTGLGRLSASGSRGRDETPRAAATPTPSR